jgi:hypothetical protein
VAPARPRPGRGPARAVRRPRLPDAHARHVDAADPRLRRHQVRPRRARTRLPRADRDAAAAARAAQRKLNPPRGLPQARAVPGRVVPERRADRPQRGPSRLRRRTAAGPDQQAARVAHHARPGVRGGEPADADRRAPVRPPDGNPRPTPPPPRPAPGLGTARPTRRAAARRHLARGGRTNPARAPRVPGPRVQQAVRPGPAPVPDGPTSRHSASPAAGRNADRRGRHGGRLLRPVTFNATFQTLPGHDARAVRGGCGEFDCEFGGSSGPPTEPAGSRRSGRRPGGRRPGRG